MSFTFSYGNGKPKSASAQAATPQAPAAAPGDLIKDSTQDTFMADVIEASRTRPYLIRALELLKTKHENRPVRKHGNIPL